MTINSVHMDVLGDTPGLGVEPEPASVPQGLERITPMTTAATSRRPTVSLIIPAKNEARNLPHVLEHLPEGLDEVILVDGQSRDVSCLVAKACRPDIRIVMESTPGKGAALRAGFAAARGDFIVAMDADGSMSPEEIPQYVYFLEHGFDFVKGSRFMGGGGSVDITPLRRLGNKALLTIANTLFDAQFTDLCYGFFAFRRCYLEYLDLHSVGFEIETELTVRASVVGLRIAEVPSLELSRRTGRSSLHAIQDGQRVLATLFEERKRASAKRPSAHPLTSSDGGAQSRFSFDHHAANRIIEEHTTPTTGPFRTRWPGDE
jgi:glycosyltransferase involved in cell wall biosynthesis